MLDDHPCLAITRQWLSQKCHMHASRVTPVTARPAKAAEWTAGGCNVSLSGSSHTAGSRAEGDADVSGCIHRQTADR